MKIIFRISKMGFGGAERVFLSVAKVLKEKYGWTPIFVVDNLGVGVTEKKIVELGMELYGLNSKRTLNTIWPFTKLINNIKPDVIISAYTDTNFAAVVSAKLSFSKAPIIVSEHASLNEHWQKSSFSRKLTLKFYVKYGYCLASHILAVSNGIAKQIIGYGHRPSKVSCIHNPVRFEPKIPLKQSSSDDSDVVKLLAVGRVTPQKDYMTLLKAFEIVSNNHNAHLTIVGGVHNKAEKNQIDTFLESKAIKDKISFIDFTENVSEYYQNSDIFVLSSAWEGFGNVIVEAMTYGLPIVSTDCNHGPAEILEAGKYGKLVPVRDYLAMANAISDLISNNPFNKHAQIQRSLDFSEEKISQQYNDLILAKLASK